MRASVCQYISTVPGSLAQQHESAVLQAGLCLQFRVISDQEPWPEGSPLNPLCSDPMLTNQPRDTNLPSYVDILTKRTCADKPVSSPFFITIIPFRFIHGSFLSLDSMIQLGNVYTEQNFQSWIYRVRASPRAEITSLKYNPRKAFLSS